MAFRTRFQNTDPEHVPVFRARAADLRPGELRVVAEAISVLACVTLSLLRLEAGARTSEEGRGRCQRSCQVGSEVDRLRAVFRTRLPSPRLAMQNRRQ